MRVAVLAFGFTGPLDTVIFELLNKPFELSIILGFQGLVDLIKGLLLAFPPCRSALWCNILILLPLQGLAIGSTAETNLLSILGLSMKSSEC